MRTKQNSKPRTNLWNGREIKERKTFYVKGTFESLYAAKAYLQKNGYSEGSLARNLPVGLLKGDYNIQKWYNLSDMDIAELDGVMLSADFREGNVELLFFND